MLVLEVQDVAESRDCIVVNCTQTVAQVEQYSGRRQWLDKHQWWCKWAEAQTLRSPFADGRGARGASHGRT
ncbi:unnamed protein product [Cylicostephanus goldi]|uniref:Uncharacterized protein n=1 Tax=Cylicostephanus goldi TaxID=71465 RepID=A0A3P7NII9_CYLGO|nr:unnamed protein product [Cylicostephanus goldi]